MQRHMYTERMIMAEHALALAIKDGYEAGGEMDPEVFEALLEKTKGSRADSETKLKALTTKNAARTQESGRLGPKKPKDADAAKWPIPLWDLVVN